MVKGYLIKPLGQPPYPNVRIDFSITAVEMTGDYNQINELIGSQFFDVITFNQAGDGIFIDDEGAVRDDQTHYIKLAGVAEMPFTVYGSGLVLGVDNRGENKTPSISIDELHDKVQVYGLG